MLYFILNEGWWHFERLRISFDYCIKQTGEDGNAACSIGGGCCSECCSSTFFCAFFFCLPCRNHKSWPCCGFCPIPHPFNVLGFETEGLHRKGAAAVPLFWTDAAAYEHEERLDLSLPQGIVRGARKWCVVSSKLRGAGPVLEGAIYCKTSWRMY